MNGLALILLVVAGMLAWLAYSGNYAPLWAVLSQTITPFGSTTAAKSTTGSSSGSGTQTF